MPRSSIFPIFGENRILGRRPEINIPRQALDDNGKFEKHYQKVYFLIVPFFRIFGGAFPAAAAANKNSPGAYLYMKRQKKVASKAPLIRVLFRTVKAK